MSCSIRVSVRSQNESDACAWYRSIGPFAHLERTSYCPITFTPMEEISTTHILKTDIAFFSRPCSEQEVEAIHKFKQLKVPVIVDWDDDITEIPSDNPYAPIFRTPQRMAHLVNGIEMADVLMVSTQALADKWAKLSPLKKIYVVPNALDERLFYESKPGTNRTICWRGAAGHQRDIDSIGQEIIEYSNSHTDETFTFFGYNPWKITDALQNRSQFIPPIANVPDYFMQLKKLSPRFGMVPLFDGPFARAKSNIAWLEMTWAGAVCVVPNWSEWDTLGTWCYDEGNFLQALTQMTTGNTPEYLDKMHEAAWKYIQEHRTLAQVNKIRERILNALVGIGDLP